MPNPHFGSKLKIPKKHVKIHSKNHIRFFCADTARKKTPNIPEMRAFLNRPSCNAYSPRKILTLGQKFNSQKKTCQNPFFKSFKVVPAKNRS